MLETGLVKTAAGSLKTQIVDELAFIDQQVEALFEQYIEVHIRINSKPKWFGLVKRTPPTHEQAREFVSTYYGSRLERTFDGQRFRNRARYLMIMDQMCDVALANDGYVYLSGEQVHKLGTNNKREQEED